MIKGHKNNAVIPCGLNLENFYPMNKNIAREMIGLSENKKYILFPSGFDNPVKNYPLAKKAVDNLNEEIEIIELKNKTREEVSLLLNACNLMLLTSFSEGSPQIIKEAMACNCPIVATDVGDIKEIIGDTEGCFLVSFKNKDSRRDGEPKSKKTQSELIEETSQKIEEALKFAEQVGRTKGSTKIIELGLDSATVAKKIFDVYKEVLEIK
ncbi:MAG: glycosyltransferase [Ignavibacteriales bacterium]|nr:glycosyltransferase [Ignavibacteriales bacterium]